MIGENELKALWQTVFGDDRSYIDQWFHAFFRPELTAVKEQDGSLAAMAFVLPVGTLNGGSCASLYAVASAPGLRGTGLGKAVTADAVHLAEKAGFSHILLRPADRGLFGFYRKLGFFPAFPVSETLVRLPETGCQASPCDPERYLEVRSSLLCSDGVVLPSVSLLSFFSSSGGRLYAGDGFCAAVEEENGRTVFKELFTDGRTLAPEILSSMSAASSAAAVRQPAFSSEAVPFAMRYGASGKEHLHWPGLMLD